MKLSKKLFRAAALALTALALTASLASCGNMRTTDKIKADGKLVMLTNAAFPPFEYVSNGNVVGVDVDIATEIAKELGVELEVKDMAFDGIVAAVKSGKGDIGVAGMSINEERLESVDFSVEYVSSSLYIIVPANGSTVASADDLVNKTIGVQTGTTADVFTSDIEGATISRFNNFLDAAAALKAGKCDAIVVDELPSQEIVKANADTLVRLETPLTEEKYAIALQKGNDTLLETINTVLERLLSEGKIDSYIFNHTQNASN